MANLFSVSNGVRQGGVLSPYLFNVYIDDLINELCKCNVGCYISGVSANNLGYADDMTLLSPSVKGLRSLIQICEAYANKFDIVFNAIKTVCMIFKGKKANIQRIPRVQLNNRNIIFVSVHTYLGHVICSDMSDDEDIERQRRAFCVRANMLLRLFKLCTPEVKKMLFAAYCKNIYCCHLWVNFRSKAMNKLKVMYNNVWRRLLGVPTFCSASAMFVTSHVMSLGEVIRRNSYSFKCRLEKSSNALIAAICSSDRVIDSIFYKVWRKQLYVM